MIPHDRTEAVSRGLREAFGVSTYDDIARITRGRTSSLVFRIVVAGSPYLLKIILREESPARHFANMRLAAGTSLAPRVWYASVEDRIFITDFVDAEPFPVAEALHRMPAALRRLHALPLFDRAPFNTTCTFLLDNGAPREGFLGQFQATNILPKADSEEFFARHTELATAYVRDDADQVSSHNDLFKPDNILSSARRTWLVDWEASFRNDRYADLAVVANQLVTNRDQELTYLSEYFGAPPTPRQQARFHLMQQLSHLFYTAAFLSAAAAEPVPNFHDYHRRLWIGEIDLSTAARKVLCGHVHWQQFLHNVAQPRYREALEAA